MRPWSAKQVQSTSIKRLGSAHSKKSFVKFTEGFPALQQPERSIKTVSSIYGKHMAVVDSKSPAKRIKSAKLVSNLEPAVDISMSKKLNDDLAIKLLRE